MTLLDTAFLDPKGKFPTVPTVAITITVAMVETRKYPRMLANPVEIADPDHFFAHFGKFLTDYPKTAPKPKRTKKKRS